MTYGELSYRATKLYTKGKITLDKYMEMTKPLDREIEQEPKTGRWITWKEAGNEIASETRFECSVCHDSAQTLCNGLDLLSPYCPNCGAKMVEPQESELENPFNDSRFGG